MSYRLLKQNSLFLLRSFPSQATVLPSTVAQVPNLGISFSFTPTSNLPTSNSTSYQALSVTQATVSSLGLPASILAPVNPFSTQHTVILKQNRSCCYLAQNPSVTGLPIVLWIYLSLTTPSSHMLFLWPGMFSYPIIKLFLHVSASMSHFLKKASPIPIKIRSYYILIAYTFLPHKKVYVMCTTIWLMYI